MPGEVLSAQDFAARYGKPPEAFASPPPSQSPQPLSGPGLMPPGTVATGMQTNPNAPDAGMVPLSADAQRQIALMKVQGLMGDRAGVQSSQDILNSDPTYLARVAQGKGMGKNASLIAAKQSAGSQIITGLDRLQDLINGADDSVIKGSMGPYNMSKVHPWTVAPLSPTAYFAPEDMTPPQAAQAYNPSTENAKNWDFQNAMEHLVDALTEQFVGATGGAGNNMSDSRQKIFTDTMGRLRNATSKDEMLKIANTARQTIADTFYIPPHLPVLTPEQARKAPPGTMFKTLDGRPARVPGAPLGAFSNGTDAGSGQQ